MKNFDIKRFWQTFKWYFYENRSLILKWTASVALVTALLELLLVSISNVSTTSQYEYTHYTISVFAAKTVCMVLIGCSILFVNSNIFRWMRQKQRRQKRQKKQQTKKP